MALKELTLSLIIPVYNEQDHLKACLDSIAKQTVRPLEVIVVDNNSTDSSMVIAAKYPFVKILHEKKQGQVFAQAKGFSYSRAGVLGRIDGDVILPKDWVSKVLRHFAAHTETVAISGGANPYDIQLKWLAKRIFYLLHYGVSNLLVKSPMLWGANCALRSSAWHKAKNLVTYRRDIWEDYDLSFLLLPLGKIDRMKDLLVGCSFRAVHKPFGAQVEYHMRQVRTHYLHTRRHSVFLLFIVLMKIILIYPLALFDYHIIRRLRP